MLQSKLKIVLSVFIIYFVSMIIVMANGGSYLGRYLQTYYLPVANSLGLNTTWNFFSPDPAHTLYFRYVVVFQDSEGNETKPAVEAYFPSTKDLGDFSFMHRRESYVSRFLAIDASRDTDFFAPWLCRQNPGSVRVKAELYLKSIPNLDKAKTLSHDSINEMVDPTPLREISYDCLAKNI